MIVKYDSYNRSGSHFFISSFFAAFQEHEVDWSFHDISTLSIDKAVTVIRNPLNSIASHIQHSFDEYNDDNASKCIKENLKWMQETSKKQKSLKIINFDILVDDPNIVMHELSLFFDIKQTPITKESILFNLTPKDINISTQHIPSDKRKPQLDSIKEKILKFNHNDFNTAQEIYDGLINA
jgi:hypothetical protein